MALVLCLIKNRAGRLREVRVEETIDLPLAPSR